MTQYYVKVNSSVISRVKSIEVEKKLTKQSGNFDLLVSDPTNTLYDTISSGDEVEAYRTSDDLKLFGGYIEKIERDKKRKFELEAKGGDYTTKLNQIMVRAQIYNGREFSVIVRDLMNNYVMNTDLIDDCDATTNWVATGDWSGLAADTTDDADGYPWSRLGSACLKVDCTYSGGTGTLTKTMSSTLDYAATDYICLYVYIADTTDLGTNIRLHLGQDSSNYYTITIASSTLSNGWNYIEFDMVNKTTGAGYPSLSSIDWYQLDFDIDSGASGINLRFDDLRRTPHTPADFTVSNVAITIYYTNIQFKNMTVFESTKKVAEIRPTKYDFYVDVNKILNFAIMGTTDSGVDLIRGTNIITDDFWDDDSNLVNFVTVYGGRQMFTFEEKFNGDGSTSTFPLTYRPIDTYIEVDGTEQLGYQEGMKDTFDYEADRENKDVIFQAGSIPGGGTDNVVVRYTYSVPIIVQKGDPTSIANYSQRDGKIENPHITTRADAIVIASDYIEKWKDPIVNGKITCTIQPTIDVGETVDITDSKFFSATQVMTVVALKHILIGRRLRTEVTLTERTKEIEAYLNEIFERLNALEEKEKGESELIARLVPFLDDIGLLDDPPNNLAAQTRNINTNAWCFSDRDSCAFSKPIQFLGGPGKYGANLITNPSN